MRQFDIFIIWSYLHLGSAAQAPNTIISVNAFDNASGYGEKNADIKVNIMNR